MYIDYANEIELADADVLYEPSERTSDIQLPPVMNTLLLAGWIAISLVGFAVIFVAKKPVPGTVIIAVPTFIGMVIKPTFALCIMMLVLPTGAGIGYKQAFSLDRAVGIALAVSFLLNILITRPRLRIGNRALWIVGLYTLWVILSSLAAPYFGLEMRRAFTQVQLLALALIVYWILETNTENTFRWVLRAYVIGTLGTALLAFISGAAMRAIQETSEARYAATLGGTINANMLAALTSMAFLAAIYLFARDKHIVWRLLYLSGILFFPIILLRTGSRGNLVALAVTVLLPFVFVRQVWRRPTLAVFLLVVILLACLSAGLLIRSEGLQAPLEQRLTSIERAKEAISYRMTLLDDAVKAAVRRPAGTSYYAWFARTGSYSFPHSDFFLILGVYGLPGAFLFAWLVVSLIRTIWRMPWTLEKLYARAVLTYLLVVGMNNANVYKKFYWVFLAVIIAAEGMSYFYSAEHELPPVAEGEEAHAEENQW